MLLDLATTRSDACMKAPGFFFHCECLESGTDPGVCLLGNEHPSDSVCACIIPYISIQMHQISYGL